jgi:pimeloyl-ACP methyl ester carboxylesterase/DNA-binding CsgD family transcriptional regulator
MGDLATSDVVRRLMLPPLSLEAVRTLTAGSNSELDPVTLHRLTGGNPFFVSEVLAAGGVLSPTVRDAVFARAARLSPAGRAVLEAAAVIGPPIETWLLVRVGDGAAAAVEECLAAGMLRPAEVELAFRHELAREAILEAIPPPRRLALHARVLAELVAVSSQDLARLAHHAEGAHDRAAVLAYAPAAAERAARLRAHREAAAQYARALRFADGLLPEHRAALLEARAQECYLTDQLPEAIDACEAALELRRQVGDPAKTGDTQRRLSRFLWFAGRNAEAEQAARAALATLEARSDDEGATPQLAMAYSNLSQLRMLARDTNEAVAWGEKAIALAERDGDLETLVHALNNVGAARLGLGDEQGRLQIERSLHLAREARLEDHAARAYGTLAATHGEQYRFALADRYLVEGIAYCTEHDLDHLRLYLLAWRALSLFYQGQWREASETADSVLRQPRGSPVSRIMALVALGRLRVRQGDPAAASVLDEALALAEQTGELQRLGPVRTARAEAAWLAGDRGRVVAEVRDAFDLAVRLGHRWLTGELAFWLWRAGELQAAPPGAFEPFALQIAGEWSAASARWRELGCPYEVARALADGDNEAALRYAQAEFTRLGAGPDAAIVTRRLDRLVARRAPVPPPRLESTAGMPETRYARSGDVHIAYQVVGDGPLDLVFVMGWVSSIDWYWAEPRVARFLRRLASFSRLILFDKRGTGLSDRVAELPTLEQRMDDVRAVMDAVGSARAALFGISEGGAMCALFAATYPERTAALVIYGGYAKRRWDPEYPWAPTPVERQQFFDAIERDWGGVVDLDTLAPSTIGDEEFRRWWAAYLRRSASPGAALALAHMNTEIDIRGILPAIRVPTLILHRTGDLDIDVGGARYLAERIAGAKYVELPGVDHLVFVGDLEAILREVEVFLTGTLPLPDVDRVLATLMLTGIVGAAATAVRLGDRAWGELVTAHDVMVREHLARFRGREVKQTIGGFLAAFDGSARAIRCACAIVAAAQDLGLAVRAGLHAGECETVGGELGGVALQIAERVFDRAGSGQVVVSNTVKDLVAGSGIEFEELSSRLVTGPEHGWRLFQIGQGRAPVRDASPVAMPEAPRPPDALSPREREVAILVARGLSNRDIALELVISIATAERHVANILNKLGFHSRAQIAAWAVAHDLVRVAPG